MFQVLDTVGDARAKYHLEQAAVLLQQQAGKLINPGLRQSFLAKVPDHIAIRAAAW